MSAKSKTDLKDNNYLSVKVALNSCYYRYAPDNIDHLMDPIQEKRSSDHQEKHSCQSTYISCMK